MTGDGDLVRSSRGRAIVGITLAVAALVLFLYRVPLSLLPLFVGLVVVTGGRTARGGGAQPIAFLGMVPIGIAIAVVAIARS